jgi:hypothetical protein
MQLPAHHSCSGEVHSLIGLRGALMYGNMLRGMDRLINHLDILGKKQGAHEIAGKEETRLRREYWAVG